MIGYNLGFFLLGMLHVLPYMSRSNLLLNHDKIFVERKKKYNTIFAQSTANYLLGNTSSNMITEVGIVGIEVYLCCQPEFVQLCTFKGSKCQLVNWLRTWRTTPAVPVLWRVSPYCVRSAVAAPPPPC